MAVATNGNVGSPTLGKSGIAALRHDEARGAADVLGVAGLIWMDEDDELLFDNKVTRLKFVDAIRQAEADIIVTHNPNDYHPDHIACSKLGTDARILSAVRLVQTMHPALEHSPELYYMDSVAGINFLPQYYVDISNFMDLKAKALACHDSQAAWIRTIFNQELMDIARIHLAFRGLKAGVSGAEAFCQPAYWPKRSIALPFL